LHGPVRAPLDAGSGTALVKLSYDAWGEGYVRSSEHEVRVVMPWSGAAAVPVSPRLSLRLAHPDRDGRIPQVIFTPDGRRILGVNSSGTVV
jgi:hypothetical protein